MATRNIHSVKIFCSYAHKDKALRDELAKHFKRMNILAWYDRDINSGTNWIKEIDQNLETADIVLLLISVDFMASKYCYEKEMARALERQKKDGISVIPVLMRPVYWQDAPFSYLQASPASLLPVTRWPNQDEAFVEIATDVRKEFIRYSKHNIFGMQKRIFRLHATTRPISRTNRRLGMLLTMQSSTPRLAISWSYLDVLRKLYRNTRRPSHYSQKMSTFMPKSANSYLVGAL